MAGLGLMYPGAQGFMSFLDPSAEVSFFLLIFCIFLFLIFFFFFFFFFLVRTSSSRCKCWIFGETSLSFPLFFPLPVFLSLSLPHPLFFQAPPEPTTTKAVPSTKAAPSLSSSASISLPSLPSGTSTQSLIRPLQKVVKRREKEKEKGGKRGRESLCLMILFSFPHSDLQAHWTKKKTVL